MRLGPLAFREGISFSGFSQKRPIISPPQCRECIDDPLVECKTRGGGYLSNPSSEFGHPTIFVEPQSLVSLGEEIDRLLKNLLASQLPQVGKSINLKPCKIERILIGSSSPGILPVTQSLLSTWAIEKRYEFIKFIHTNTLKGAIEIIGWQNAANKPVQLAVFPDPVLLHEISGAHELTHSDLKDIKVPIIVVAHEGDPMSNLQNSNNLQVLTMPLTIPKIWDALDNVVNDLERTTPPLLT